MEAGYAGPVRVSGRLDAPVRQTRRGWRTRLVFASPSGIQRALVWLPRGRGVADLEKGREAMISGKLRPPRRPRDPGDFDEAGVLEASGCAWVLHAHEVVVSSNADARFLPWAWAQRARLSAEAAYGRRLPPERAALLAGIALGDAGALSNELAKAVRDAGATHLLVASGSNIGFAAAAAALLGLAAGLRPRPRAVLTLGVAGFYTLMAGADPPCVRAWVMLAAAIGARSLGREITASTALIFAAAVMLVVDPASALSPSAIMSVGACAAIIWAGGAAEQAAPAGWPWLARSALALFLISIAIAVALWPLWVYVFGRASLVGPLANVILVPLSGPLLAGGFVLWATDAWLPAAAPLAAKCVGFGLWIFERTCVRAAALPWAAVELRPWTGVEIAAWLLLLGALGAYPRKRVTSALALSALMVFALGRAFAPRPPVSAVFLTDGSVLLRFNGGPAWHLGPKPPRAKSRQAARALGAGDLGRVAVGGPWRLRLGTLEIIMGGCNGKPSLRSTKGARGPFAIIESPRASAFELVTDGNSYSIEDLLRPGVRLSPHFPQRGQDRCVTDAGARPVIAQGARRTRGDGGANAVGAVPARRRSRHRARRRRDHAPGRA